MKNGDAGIFPVYYSLNNHARTIQYSTVVVIIYDNTLHLMFTLTLVITQEV